MGLGGHGSPEYIKQSIWRGCPEATDAPDTICRPKMIKKVVIGMVGIQMERKNIVLSLIMVELRVFIPN